MKKILIILVSFFITHSLTAESRIDIGPEVIKRAIKNAELESQQKNLKESGKIFIIKVTHNSVMTNKWAEILCRNTADTLADVYGHKTESHCFLDDSSNSNQLINTVTKKVKADFELNLTRQTDSIKVELINLKQTDQNITNKVGWIIENKDGQRFQFDLKDRLTDSYFTINNMNLLRDVLVNLVYKSYNSKFQKKSSMSRDDLYEDLKGSSLWTPRTRKFILAGSELLATLSFGWYGYHYLSNNQPDYDYKKEGFIESIENKITFGSMVRYDDNSWNVNKNHVYAGVVYYLQCRGAGLTALDSYLCTLAGSVAWESVVEWREVFSINDHIFTAHGGAILGESIHQMGRYIDQKAPNWFKNSIGWLWRGPKKTVQYFNSKALGGMDEDLDADDSLVSGKFEFDIGVAKMSNGKMEKLVGIDNEVTMIPFMLEPGREIKFIKNIVETDFNLSIPTNSIFQEYDVFAKVVMAAYYNKNISTDQNDIKNGYSFYIGPSAAIDIKNDYSTRDDFMGIVHVIGTSAKLINFYKGFKITSTLDFWGDSVMMKSMVIESYKGANPTSELVGNLKEAGYYHGFGYTSKGQVIIEYGKTSFGANFSYGNSSNTNERQRDLGKILTNLDVSRTNLVAGLFVERKISKNLKLKLAVDVAKRTDKIAGFSSESKTIVTNKIFLTYYF